uniref:SAGA-associated factor 11 n=1 Tax=Araucaria cunninghamii TaxID=56994 RepID=A0A0D6R4N3_ARACU
MAGEDGKKEMWVFKELLDSVIVDVASESHREVRLGLDPRLNYDEEEEFRLSMEARAMVEDPSSSCAAENSGKFTEDIFGQTHPAVASEVFSCMNCGRAIVAGRFAPHLEKCMGKGRKARLKATRSSTSQQRRARTNPVPIHNTSLNSSGTYNSNRMPNRSYTTNMEVFQKTGADLREGTS